MVSGYGELKREIDLIQSRIDGIAVIAEIGKMKNEIRQTEQALPHRTAAVAEEEARIEKLDVTVLARELEKDMKERLGKDIRLICIGSAAFL